MNHSLRILALVCAGVFLAACGASDNIGVTPPGLRATHLAIVSGNQQAADQQAVLENPLVVAVTTDDGTPTPGITVEWYVTGGGGVVSLDKTLTDSHGQTSVVWTLGPQSGSQGVVAQVRSISTPAVFSATASATPGPPPTPRLLVVRYDGTAVTTAYVDSTGSDRLSSIWGSSHSNVVALGTSDAGFELRYNGTQWSRTTGTSVGRASVQPSISGTSPSDIYVIKYFYKMPTTPAASWVILHYDGQSWTTAYTYAPATVYLGLNAIWARSPADVFAVGDSGYVARYNGTNWSVTHTDTDESLLAVWADPSSSAVFAVGERGAIVRFDGTSWHKQASGTSGRLVAVWGSSAQDVFVSPVSGGILHYDGTAWSTQNTNTPGVTLLALWGFSPTSVFAVGSNSTLLRYDGTSWTKIPVDATMDFCGVWGSSPSDIFAVRCG